MGGLWQRRLFFGLEGLFFGQVVDFLTTGTGDFGGGEVRGNFEFQAADAGKEYELIDPSHDVADLAHLLFAAHLFFCALGGLAEGDILFGQGGGGNDGA